MRSVGDAKKIRTIIDIFFVGGAENGTAAETGIKQKF